MGFQSVEGKVWKFGNSVSTDYMMPGFARGSTPEEIASFCMRAIRPEFAGLVRPGDGIIAGRNFGCGSARPASGILLTLGVAFVVAESFSRIFFRSCISTGLPAMICKGVSEAFAEGDICRLDAEAGEVTNVTTGTVVRAEPLPQVMLDILAGGGVVALLKREYGKR